MKRMTVILLAVLILCMPLSVGAFAARADLTPYEPLLEIRIGNDTGDGSGILEDLDGNGVPELLMTYHYEDDSYGTIIYTIENGEAVYLLNTGGLFSKLGVNPFMREETDIVEVNGEKMVLVERDEQGFVRIDQTYGNVDRDSAVFWLYAFREGRLRLVDCFEYVMHVLDDGSYFPDESKFRHNDAPCTIEEVADFLNSITLIERFSLTRGTDGYPLPQVLAAVRGGFMDVPERKYYSESVAWAVENGITNGTSDYLFSPNATCTRGQIVTFLWRAAGMPEPQTEANPFRDIKPGAYYYKAVLWAVENGITKGTTTDTFSPKAECTRGQAVTFLYRSCGSPAVTSSVHFEDVSPKQFCANAVQWAAQNGITKGTAPNVFSPNDNCTRGQIVTFLSRTASVAQA